MILRPSFIILILSFLFSHSSFSKGGKFDRRRIQSELNRLVDTVQLNQADFDLKVSPDQFERAKQSPACREMRDFLTLKADGKKFSVDQFLVAKKGEIVYGKQREGVYTLQSQHVMWSSTKSITAMIAAAAFERKLYYQSRGVQKRFSLESLLRDFISFEKSGLEKTPLNKSRYEKIKMKHLLMMASGMKWDESYSSLLESSFLPVLYGDAVNDVLEGSLRTEMIHEPGTVFNYSGANAIITMYVVGKVYCENHACVGRNSPYTIAANKLLYEPLGIKNGIFETDAKGLPIASSYAYLRPEDMLKIGKLIVDGGRLLNKEGKFIQRILPRAMTDTMLQDTPVWSAKEILPGSHEENHIIEQGHWNRYGWGWRNTQVRNFGRLVYEQDFQDNPKDMMVFAGHFGNSIVMIPSEKIVIAMTGQNDDGYWRKLNYLTSKVRQCFLGVKSNAAYPQEKKSSLSVTKKVSLGVEAIKTELAQKNLVKDICSCLYISEVGKKRPEQDAVELCKLNTPSDAARGLRNAFIHVEHNPMTKIVKAEVLEGIFGSAKAKFFGREYGGCRIVD